MLSPPTLELLANLQAASGKAYTEGGLLYTYTEAANQAHSRLPESLGRATHPNLDAESLKELARFLQASQGNPAASEPADLFLEHAGRLMQSLERDLKFDEVTLHLEVGEYDMSAAIKMAKRTENRYFALELFWSID